MLPGQLKAITPERVENIVRSEKCCGIIRPEERVVDHVSAAYSLTNTAELELCRGLKDLRESTDLALAYLPEEAFSMSWLISKQNWQDVENPAQLVQFKIQSTLLCMN